MITVSQLCNACNPPKGCRISYLPPSIVRSKWVKIPSWNNVARTFWPALKSDKSHEFSVQTNGIISRKCAQHNLAWFFLLCDHPSILDHVGPRANSTLLSFTDYCDITSVCLTLGWAVSRALGCSSQTQTVVKIVLWHSICWLFYFSFRRFMSHQHQSYRGCLWPMTSW